MSANPAVPVSSINGRPIPPPPALSWRTRRDTIFTSTFGLPTFDRACLAKSGFMQFSSALRYRARASMQWKSWVIRFVGLTLLSPFPVGLLACRAYHLPVPLYEYELCEGSCAACGG